MEETRARLHPDTHTCAISCERFFDFLRTNMIREEELINHRLSWMIQSQSAFFLAFGIV